MKNRQSSQVLRRKGFAASLKRNWGSYLLVAPFMLIFLVFTVAPVFVTLVISFTKYSVLEAPVFVGLENYKQLFLNDEVFAKAVRNTLIFAIFTGPVGYVLSFLASWAINETSRKIRGLLTFVFYIPSISGTIYTIWNIIFSGDIYGYANSLLLRLRIISEPIQWFTTEEWILPLIIVVQLWMSLGTGFLAMRAGLAAIDEQYYEAGAIDGVRSRFQELFYITLPMMAPHLMTAAVLQITAMFSNSTVAQNLTGFPSTNYAGHLVMTHLMDYTTYRVERGYASAIAVLLFLVMILLNRLFMKILRKVGA
jgi:ABC transporter, permease protein